jgi:diguanylate cyclase (GGDEF)-like protein/PAS domain S-box-containing protein
VIVIPLPWSHRHRALFWWLRALAAFAAYALAGQIGLALPAFSPLTPLFWPAAGVAVAMLLRAGRPGRLGLIAGAITIEWLRDTPTWLALPVALGQIGGPWLAARWLERVGLDPRLSQARDCARLAAAGVGAALVAAANRAAWLGAAGLVPPIDLPSTALQAWMGESLGIALTAVPLLAAPRKDRASAASRRTTALLVGAAWLSVACALVLPSSQRPLAMGLLVAPPVLLVAVAVRDRIGFASGVSLVLAVALLGGTALGLGPFAQAPTAVGPTRLWAYLSALAALVMVAHAHVAALRHREERWAFALDGSDLGVADWNLRPGDAQSGFSTPRWHALMNDPGGVQSAAFDHWLGIVHPDDRPALRAALAADPRSGAAPRHPVRVHVRDRWRWFDVQLVVAERDATGLPLRIVASAADLTHRREAEEAQHLSSNLFMNLHEGLVVTDAWLRVLDANPAYSRITGVPRDELIGTVPDLLRSPAADPVARTQQASLWTALRTQGSWAGDVVDRRRNGEPCALHLTASAVHSPDGDLLYHMLMVSDVTEDRLQRDRLVRQANFDELTQLPNRARLGQLLAEAIAAADHAGSLLVVCSLDLDHFKSINARLGHQAGDLLLAETANRLRSSLRARGPDGNDAAARLGGDEFALLLHADSVDQARAAVQRVLRVVAQPAKVAADAEPVAVTASVGATIYPLDPSDADTLLRHADHAMYGVKQSGRNGYLFFDPEYSRRTEERVLAIGRVQDALDHHEFALFFQPKVDLRRGTVLGFEALLRWDHPEHGLLPPMRFLPLIENTGLSARIGDFVLASALDQLDAWLAQGLDLSIGVNISARHLQESDFAQRLAELLARHSRPLGPRLELEVLETAALTDVGYSAELLERCSRLGVRWALDDFGTGYSTLTYLKQLPVQTLKIDRSFVRAMLEDAQDRAIVEGVIGLARTFGCTAVAEGVETAAQGRVLLDLGCEIGQGDGIAPPMSADAVPGWIREWRGLFTLAAASAGGDAAADAAGAASGGEPAGHLGGGSA